MLKIGALTALLVSAEFGPALADDPPAPDARPALAGAWTGTLDVAPQLQLRILLTITEAADGTLKAHFASPDQGPTEYPVVAIERKDNVLTFTVPAIGGSYTGKIDPKAPSIDGEWAQVGKKFALKLTPAKPGSLGPPVAPAELAGLWQGALEVGGNRLRLVLRVEKGREGDRLVPYLDSPDQGARGIPVTAISLKQGALTFECKGIGGSYKGKLDAAGQSIDGSWSQGGPSIPLILMKTDKVSEVRRP